MKKNYFYGLLVLAIFAVIGCSDSLIQEPTPPSPLPAPGTKQTSYYIAKYTIANSIDCYLVSEFLDYLGILNYDLFPLQPPIIGMSFDGEQIYGEENEQFIYLQEKYGDTQYNGETNPNNNWALAHPIEKITMFCHEDFDAEHPAGAAVDDIVKIHISTYETFIRNGYEYPDGWTHRKYYGWGVMPVGEFYLSEVNEDNSKLIPALGGMTFMKFMQEPEVAGEYPFTLTITMNGEEVSKTFKVTFGETTAEE